jgi:hypothetical protein
MTKSTPQKLKYQQEYNKQPKQVAKRVKNNAARLKAIDEGKVSKGDGNDVAHKTSLENNGGNGKSNLKVEPRSKNRAWRKGSSSYNPDK